MSTSEAEKLIVEDIDGKPIQIRDREYLYFHRRPGGRAVWQWEKVPEVNLMDLCILDKAAAFYIPADSLE